MTLVGNDAVQVINSAVKLDWDNGVAVILLDSPPVNALCQPLREGMLLGIKAALEQGAKAVVLACEGRTFCAGADISEFGKPLVPPMLTDVQDAFEASPVPVVAAIHGTALGGGFEVALSCHYRVAVPSAQLGLPEVNLGLLPGAGGTQRVPRVVGIEAALDMIVGGKPVSAAKAQQLGLIDEVAGEDTLRSDAVVFARAKADAGGALPRIRDRKTPESASEAQAIGEQYRERNARQFKGFKAPGNIVKAVVAAAELPFDAGIQREFELFTELMESTESAAQIYAFFAERATAKIPGLGKDVKPRKIESAAVIGAGTMGTGITLALLAGGFPVALVDLNAEALAKAEARIRKTIEDMAAKGRIKPAAAEAQIAALTTAPGVASVGHVDLVIEAVFERIDLKKRIFADLDGVMKPGAILATNTSFLDVDEIAAATKRPAEVVGLHFFAPANIMRLLEVVRGKETAQDVLATAMWLGGKLRKLAVVSGVCDGFIANRVMTRRSETATRLILEGPMPADVDRVMRDYGFAMGPFQMLDLVGLDVVGWDRETSAGRTVQEILCEGNNWGQKTGSGYYDYSGDKPAPARSALEAIATIRANNNSPTRSFTDEDILYELLDPIVNEGAKLVDEAMVYRASDIDMAVIAGYGWPVYRGGPMFWGDTVGLAGIVERLKARVARGEPLTISPLLERYAAEGKRFVRN